MNSTEERDRPVRELLGVPDFLRLWLAGGAANAMRWLELLASGLFAFEATGSTLAVAGVVAIRQLPQFAFGAFAGAMSEAVNRKLVVTLAMAVPASVSAVVALLAATGHLALWHIAVANLVSGILWATEMSTRRRMVGEVAGAHRGGKARCVVRHGQRRQLFHIGDLDVAHTHDQVDVVVVLLEHPGDLALQIGQAHAAPSAVDALFAR